MKTLLSTVFFIGFSTFSPAQTDSIKSKAVTFTGSLQSNMLLPATDKKIGTEEYSSDFLTNTYLDLHLNSKFVDAGVRLEYMKHPLPGFEKDFKGWGVPHFYIKGKYKDFEMTAGTFYDQFGSGFIFRTYEERSLGIDNSLLGARMVYKPFGGRLSLKVLGGKQRRYWAHNDAFITGADAEYTFDLSSETRLLVGASVTDKCEATEEIMADATHSLAVPHHVTAFDVRAQLYSGAWNILAEWAQKGQDPGFDNGYTYRHGNVAMLSTSYSRKGLSLLAQVKRSDQMGFRSRRSMSGISSMINHLPAFTQQHTYTLPALYTYATNPDGEWAYQFTAGYLFKRGTSLGGKYGTHLKFNYSYVHGIDKNEHLSLIGTKAGGNGYGSGFFKWGGSIYYQDINLSFDKRFSPAFRLHLMYMNQIYNKTVVEGKGGSIHSNIFVAEGKYAFSRKTAIRSEFQYLQTSDDKGDWIFGLLEFSLAPHWIFTLSDLYNIGDTDIHYYQGGITFSMGAHRLQAAYARTRAGFNCVGGVCRYVPASKGLLISYNYNF